MSTFAHNVVAPRLACDSLVALGAATVDGSTLFAKNSDRPARECQPLLQAPRQHHRSGARLRCTYIEIPQVAETARLIGSRPYWCWGFEHGLNEHGVAIGNHTVFTRDILGNAGLIGMDLVRLGLERGHSAEEAVDTIAALLATYGQGGAGYADTPLPYHNSFLVADRRAAFVLETSDRQWAARRVNDIASLSNHLTIATDWDALSSGAIEHAIAAGWWNEARDERFDFAAAYRDSSIVPEAFSAGRHQRTCALLGRDRGRMTIDSLKRTLRDHSGSLPGAAEPTLEDPHAFSVCMHADPFGTTTASVIADISPDADAALVYRASFGSPCIGVFIPLYLDAEIPTELMRGGADPSDDSTWWQFNALLQIVAQDWKRRLPYVRGVFDRFETSIEERVYTERLSSRSATHKAAFMRDTLNDLLVRVQQLTAELTQR